MSSVFISYSRKDSKIVDRIMDEVEKAGHDVWLDREDIRGGEQWRRNIVTAIDEAKAFIVVLSPNSVQSDNVRKELDLADGAKVRLLPIIIQETDIPPGIKYQLAGLQRIDFCQDFNLGLQELLIALGGSDLAPIRIASAPPQKKWWGDWRIWGAVIALLLIAIVVVALLLSGKDGEKISTNLNQTEIATTDTSELVVIPTEATAQPEEVATAAPEITEETVELDLPTPKPNESEIVSSPTATLFPTPEIYDLSGVWVTNIATLRVTQNGQDILVAIEGYGGNWNEFMNGVIAGRNIEFPDTNLLGTVSLTLSEDGNTFTSSLPDLSFCGVRAGSPLPENCGFGGKWLLDAPGLLPSGSYALLIQAGSEVEGTIYSSSGASIDSITGTIYWGKGWGLEGSGVDQIGNFTWWMTANESSFDGYSGEINWSGTRASSVMVTGRVVDSLDRAIEGIGITITQDQVRIDSRSGSNGFFYATLPEGSTGFWQVGVVSISCTSRIMNADCNLEGYFGLHTRQTISIPQTEQVIFVYEVASTVLTGRVLDSLGQPVAGIRVKAIRDDGAEAWTSSSDTGDFSLPVSPGTWEVFSVIYNPTQESKRLEVIVTENAILEPIVLTAP